MQEAMKIYRNPANAIVAALGDYLRRDGTDAGMIGDLQLNANDILMAGGNVLLGAGGIGNDAQGLTFSAAPNNVALFAGNVDLNGNDLILDVDGDSRFITSVDDDLTLQLTGGDIMTFDQAEIFSSNGGSFNLKTTSGAANAPVYRFRGDTNTGTWGSGDILYGIAGGVNVTQQIEDTNKTQFYTLGSIKRKITDVNATPYTVLQTDYYLQCRRTATGVLSVNLPAIATVGDGFVLVIKDTGYNASGFNITVVRGGAGPDTIENAAADYVINVDGTAILLMANATTSNWEIW
jgi:hypothetical protein